MPAYALMQSSADLEKVWITSPRYQHNKELTDTLRRTLSLGDVSQYRGIGRFPFTEWDEVGPGWEGHTDWNVPDPEPEARANLLAALGPGDYPTAEPRAFLPTLQAALHVMRSLRSPEAYEIVELGKPNESLNHPIGFDVGYWGGGNFSILCDAAIWPTWHGPDPGAWQELAQFIELLNDALLFESESDAQDYLNWYKTQDWAEKEPTEFTLIGVGNVDVATDSKR